MHFLAIIHFGWKLGLAYVKLDMGHFNNCIRHRYVYKDNMYFQLFTSLIQILTF